MTVLEKLSVKRQKVLELLKVIQDGEFTKASNNVVSWSVYDDDDIIILLSGADKDERVKCKQEDVSKEFIWVKGSIKFIFTDGTSMILNSKNPNITIDPRNNYLIKSLEDNSLCLIILRI